MLTSNQHLQCRVPHIQCTGANLEPAKTRPSLHTRHRFPLGIVPGLLGPRLNLTRATQTCRNHKKRILHKLLRMLSSGCRHCDNGMDINW